MKHIRSIVANAQTGCKAHWYSLTIQEALSTYQSRLDALVNTLENGIPNACEYLRKDEQLHISTPNQDFAHWRDTLGADINKLDICLVKFDQ
jgi:hypothetical protein